MNVFRHLPRSVTVAGSAASYEKRGISVSIVHLSRVDPSSGDRNHPLLVKEDDSYPVYRVFSVDHVLSSAHTTYAHHPPQPVLHPYSKQYSEHVLEGNERK